MTQRFIGNENKQEKESKMRIKCMPGWALLIASVTLLCATDASAQRRAANRGSGGWGQGAPYNRMYDPSTVETVQGEVISIDRLTPGRGMSQGVHLMLKTGKETISIHLGPEWYLEKQDTEVEVKDNIEVKGSRVTFEGKPAIIAAEITKGNEVLKLRDANGVPNWAGWRRAQPK